jgi:hypothetical protein
MVGPDISVDGALFGLEMEVDRQSTPRRLISQNGQTLVMRATILMRCTNNDCPRCARPDPGRDGRRAVPGGGQGQECESVRALSHNPILRVGWQ